MRTGLARAIVLQRATFARRFRKAIFWNIQSDKMRNRQIGWGWLLRVGFDAWFMKANENPSQFETSCSPNPINISQKVNSCLFHTRRQQHRFQYIFWLFCFLICESSFHIATCSTLSFPSNLRVVTFRQNFSHGAIFSFSAWLTLLVKLAVHVNATWRVG